MTNDTATKSSNCEAIRKPMGGGSATRMKGNRNWSYRGDNTKYKKDK